MNSYEMGILVWEVLWGFFLALSCYSIFWATSELELEYQERSARLSHMTAWIIIVILSVLVVLESLYMMFLPFK